MVELTREDLDLIESALIYYSNRGMCKIIDFEHTYNKIREENRELNKQLKNERRRKSNGLW